MECVYGISLRAGKRPSTSTERRQNLPPTPTQFTLPDNWNLETSSMDGMLSNSIPGMIPGTDLMSVDNDLFAGFGDTDKSSLTDFSDTTSPIISRRAGQIPSIETNSFDNQPFGLQLDPNILSFFQTQQDYPPPMTSTSTMSFPSVEPFIKPSPSSSSRSCECFKALSQTVTNLQALTQLQHVAFDVALMRTKEAVALSSSVLACGCVADGTTFMTLVSLLTKILSIYQSCQDEWFSSATDASARNGARFTLGAYSVDEEDEENFKEEIVRTELRRVDVLIKRLQERSGSGFAEYEFKAYEGCVNFLAGKLKSASEKLGERREKRKQVEAQTE
ncbi:hypothetical protein MMC20_002333 [Loxospora ochrophaea]|nr:hypothetical protein [Loxospora ochrophaea]